MSSQPPPGEPTAPQDKGKAADKKGLGDRLVARAKTIYRKKDGSKRFSFAGPSGAKPAAAESSEAAAASKPEAPAETSTDQPNVEKIPRSKIFEEKARHLGTRFGLEIQPNEWYSSEGDVLRTEKPIRMRVRRTCQSCNTTFGPAKICPSCGSSKFVRYPPKRTEEEREKARQRVASLMKAHRERPAPLAVDWDADERKEPPLTKPSKTGGADLVRKKPRQRIRRTCCQCSTMYVGGSKACEKCTHPRCTDCPRDPAKKDKYPYGYPGDEFGANSTPFHACSGCSKVFPGGAPDGTACGSCGREKDGSCERMKPQKVEPEPDPELVKSIEAKLKAVKI